MNFRILSADLDSPAVRQFLAEHLADMEPTAPPESQHGLDIDGLKSPGVQVWVALDGVEVLGSIALKELNDTQHELKSMRTAPQARGRGVARSMLAHAETYAISQGVEEILLETGSMEFFAPARALYYRSGFTQCSPFGSYTEDPFSVFMVKRLDPVA